MNKKITFVVTGVAWKPLGGLKVIYNYADRLAEEGHELTIVYACYSGVTKQTVFSYLRTVLKYMYFLLIGDYTCKSWYSLSPRIKEKLVWRLSDKSIPLSDVYIATTMSSAYGLNTLKDVKKCYFIQDYENWGKNVTNEMVDKTYHFPMRKIVIATWLKRIVNALGEECEVVPNGFDNNVFHTTNDIIGRDKYTISMMYNTKITKGCEDCFKALDTVKEKYPALHVSIFGIPPRPASLPSWYEYTQRPTQEQLVALYNSTAIFIGASHSEGWGLTIGEAMLCGCAVACTDNDGYCEMAKDGQTALVSPVKDPSALATNIERLIEDDDLRERIAIEGNRFIQNFKLEDSYNMFKHIILQ